jgi:triosephosphate isomerase
MARRPLIAANWKMNKTIGEARAFCEALLPEVEGRGEDAEVVICPPYLALPLVAQLCEGSGVGVAAQNMYFEESGAYTGEISAAMLAKLGCSYVVVGHSERRQHHGESDDTVNAKAHQAVAAGMTPIVCVGEGLDVRQEGEQVPYTLGQVDGSLAGFKPKEIASLVVAYEPVWAIGTGEVATPEDAQEVCAAIRSRLRETAGDEAADGCRILYGGSVKAANIAGIMAQADVDGALVGGASLQAEEFGGICRFYDMPTL